MTDAADHARDVFWADEIAAEIIRRDPEEPIVIKGGISPSGVPHLGNANEIVLGYFVAEVLRERGYAVRQVYTADDLDPLRRLPRKLADLDGKIVDLGDVDASALGRNLGRPYCDIPDPFGCCDSYAQHFTRLIDDISTSLSIPVEVVSTAELYRSGAFDDLIETILRNRDTVRSVLATYQETVDENFVPFKPHCEACGKEAGRVTDVNLDRGSVEYRCSDIEVAEGVVQGCGHEGTTTTRGGKLPWRLEWVAQWAHLGVDFEPFGKDHAEGSWPSGVELAERVFDIEPPVPFVYEWFTFEGKPFSSSEGHVVLVSDALDYVEPEVLRYFFARNPTRSRDFSIERIDQLVDDFDRLEATALGHIEPADAGVASRAERLYPFLVDEIRPGRIRLPYRFAAVLGMTEDRSLQKQWARQESHLPDGAPPREVDAALGRVDRARRWARATDNEYNYSLALEQMPQVEIDEETANALEDIAAAVSESSDGDDIQGAVFEAARRHDIPVGSLFETGYRLFLDRPDGPKLGPLLGSLEQEFVIERLRRNR